MSDPRIDFLKEKYSLSKPDQKPFLFFRRKIFLIIIILATVGVIFSYQVKTTSKLKGTSTPFSLFSAIKSFITPNDGDLEGEKNDRVNILLTGIGGEGHEGPQLTDTILFVSYRPTEKKLAFLSLPRDLTVPIPGYGYRKINHANAYGEEEKSGNGPLLTSQVIGEILKQPIQYYVRVDFSGFIELINTVGGIDVQIDRPFTDPSYPVIGRENDTCGQQVALIDTAPKTQSTTSEIVSVALPEEKPPVKTLNYGCRFISLTFNEGMTHMDGKTALAFVRSRHGNNGEGSDFARSRRQQKVIMALKEKAFSVTTLLNPIRLNGILNTLQKNIATNFSVSELMRLAGDLKDLKSEEVASHVIDASDDSPLYSTSLNGAFVLLPKNDDWTPLQKMAQYIFTKEKPQVPVTPIAQISEPKPKPKSNPSRVEIQNGTLRTGLAFRASQMLTVEEYNVVQVGNAPSRNYTHTVIYDLTNGKKTNELKSLKKFFQADMALSTSETITNNNVVQKEVSVTPDDPKQLITGTNVDFLVILGQNSSDFVLK